MVHSHLPPGPNPLAVKLAVGVPEPAERGLVVAGQAVVQVEQRIVALHVLVQRVLQVPTRAKPHSDLASIRGGPWRHSLAPQASPVSILHLPTSPSPALPVPAAESPAPLCGGGSGWRLSWAEEEEQEQQPRPETRRPGLELGPSRIPCRKMGVTLPMGPSRGDHDDDSHHASIFYLLVPAKHSTYIISCLPHNSWG